jgi:hypothetical protein
MPRKTASTLIVFLLFPYCLALLLQNSRSSLPPCCHGDGKHRCATMTRLDGWEGTGQPTVRNGGCPYRSALLASRVRRTATVPDPQSRNIQLLSNLAVFVSDAAEASVSKARSHYKRGPPNFL